MDVLTAAAMLTASDGAAGHRFGHALATIVVGAWHDDPSDAVYVHTRTGSSWTEQARITASGGGPDDHSFGDGVALSDATFVVGAPGYSDLGEG